MLGHCSGRMNLVSAMILQTIWKLEWKLNWIDTLNVMCYALEQVVYNRPGVSWNDTLEATTTLDAQT